MKNPITTLHIQNFKTIKDLKVKCKRINIIIGKPNVGKSNFLEAVSLLGGSYSRNKKKYLSELIRYNKIEDLYYDKETSHPISVDTNIGTSLITFNQVSNWFLFQIASNLVIAKEKSQNNNYQVSGSTLFTEKKEWVYTDIIGEDGEMMSGNMSNVIKIRKYEFRKGKPYNQSRSSEYLLPPYGENLYTIINSYKNKNNGVFKEIAGFFKEYNLQFVIRQSDTTFEVQKKIKSIVYSNSYELIADTLQGMIFNIAAIASNKESILLFEEPEAHSFPPYVKMFAEKVIESKTNQFFITTHSPFILNTIIENTPLDEVAIFKATYDKFETKMSELPKSRIEAMLDYGNDIFFSPELSR